MANEDKKDTRPASPPSDSISAEIGALRQVLRALLRMDVIQRRRILRFVLSRLECGLEVKAP